MTTFPGIGHVAVTVSDLAASARWYGRLLDRHPVLDEDTGPYAHVVFALDDGTLLGLHGHAGGPAERGFDERRIGLDHVAFGCADRGELEGWAGRLQELGIKHSPVVDAPYGAGLSSRDPDRIGLEFFAPPAVAS